MIEKDCDWFWTNSFSYHVKSGLIRGYILFESGNGYRGSVLLLSCSRPLFSPDYYFLRIVWQNNLLVRISEYIQTDIVSKVWCGKVFEGNQVTFLIYFENAVLVRSIFLRNFWSRVKLSFWCVFKWLKLAFLVRIHSPDWWLKSYDPYNSNTNTFIIDDHSF